mmetsp:Transcript_6702/g.22893  ORF Transcript_6702/g.22893 Transcript_6702/m.22893 type:complete len:297 (-) Transcript_6702:880-1770(-)
MISAAGVPGSTSHTRLCMMSVRRVSWERWGGENCSALLDRKEHTAASSVEVMRISMAEWGPGPRELAIMADRGWCWSMSRNAKRRSASSLRRPSTDLRVTLSSTWSFSSTISACKSSSSTSSRVTMPTMALGPSSAAGLIGSRPASWARVTSSTPLLLAAADEDVDGPATPAVDVGTVLSRSFWGSVATTISGPSSPDRRAAARVDDFGRPWLGAGRSEGRVGSFCTTARWVRLVRNLSSTLSSCMSWGTVRILRPQASMMSRTTSSSSASTRMRSLVLSTPLILVRLPSYTGTRV